MNQAKRGYLARFKHYFYMGYLRHYYNIASHPHPVLFIIFAIIGASLFFTLAFFSTVAIINNTFHGNALYFYGLTFLMYFFGFSIVPSIILLIQGHRHRDRIKASEIPTDLPKNSGNEGWYILIILGIIIGLRKFFGW
jgi:hypothetical protein